MAADNPMGTDGFEFVEYAAPEPLHLRRLFDTMGLPAVALFESLELRSEAPRRDLTGAPITRRLGRAGRRVELRCVAHI